MKIVTIGKENPLEIGVSQLGGNLLICRNPCFKKGLNIHMDKISFPFFGMWHIRFKTIGKSPLQSVIESIGKQNIEKIKKHKIYERN